MQEIIINLMENFGYFGIFFLITIENLFPPIPSEVILLFGGFMTTKSNLTIIGVILVSTLGSLLGAFILYYLGKVLNKERLTTIVTGKIGRVLRLNSDDIDKAFVWFNKKGLLTVFLCRFVPILRSLISIPAGSSSMNLCLFLLYTMFGSLIWNSVLTYLGYLTGSNWTKILTIFDTYSSFVMIILGILLVILLIYFYRRKRK